MNRGDMRCGWDTDQFPNNPLGHGAGDVRHPARRRLHHRRLNFDAKVRRPSIDAVDMFHGHVGAMDLCARALLAAEQMIVGRLARALPRRALCRLARAGRRALAVARGDARRTAAHALQRNVDEPPVSGQQERLENWFNRFGG